MNGQPAPFPIWTVMKTVKRIIVAIAGELVLAAGITLLALVALVLLILPGGVEVLAIEWERATRWMRRTRVFLFGKYPLLTIQSL